MHIIFSDYMYYCVTVLPTECCILLFHPFFGQFCRRARQYRRNNGCLYALCAGKSSYRTAIQNVEQLYEMSHVLLSQQNVADFHAMLASKTTTYEVAHKQIDESFTKLWSDAPCDAHRLNT